MYSKEKFILLITIINLAESRKIPDSNLFELIIDAALPGEPTLAAGFSYENNKPNGPSKWPGLCNTGKAQSPIAYDQVAATNSEVTDRISMSGSILAKPAEIKVINNGHGTAFSFNYTEGDVPQITGGPLGKENYKFHSFHFHYPCEHTSKKFGLRCKLETHFVHFNTKYASLTEAVAQADGLAVIGLMYETGIASTLKSLPYVDMVTKVYKYNAEYVEKVNTFSYAQAMGFICVPKIISYKGSLTTPACAEAVTWIVVDNLYQVRATDMAKLQKISDESGRPLKMNNRPVQPLNGRPLKAYNEL